jgi:nucleotide-binding universal stress UspA family protein
VTYRTILVELVTQAGMEERLRVADGLARRFGAMLVGMHAAPSPVELVAQYGWAAGYVGPDLIDAQEKANVEARTRARETFRRRCGDNATSAWRAAEGDPARLVAAAARTADLVVAGRDQDGGAGLAEALLTTTGVPVLAFPPEVPAGETGRSVLVAWNGSRESARAAHDALPLLRHGAREIALCAIGEEAAASLDDAAAMLARHGVRCEPVRLAGGDADAGALLLAEATARHADLLVMGAYGHARLREMMFGGATRHALARAPIPVLFGG